MSAKIYGNVNFTYNSKGRGTQNIEIGIKKLKGKRMKIEYLFW